MSYALPRILYDSRDNNPSDDQTEYVYLRESPVQLVKSDYYARRKRARCLAERLRCQYAF